MATFKVEMEIMHEGELSLEATPVPMSKSHLNAREREAVWLQVADAMATYGLTAAITRVAKARESE